MDARLTNRSGDVSRPAPGPGGLLPGIRNIRIVLLTGLGDVVHGLPLACALKRARPDCRITWVVEPMPAGILEGHPAIDRVVVFHKREGWRGVHALRAALRAAPRPDLTLNLNVYLKSVFPTVLAPARRRLGFDRARTRDGVALFCNEHVPARPRAHTMDMFLEFLAHLGVPAEPVEWRLDAAARELAPEVARLLHDIDRPIAGVVPASANPKKDWVPERYVPLVERMYDELGLQPVLLGGPGARETAVAQMIVQRARTPVVNALGDGIRRLLCLIRASRVLIAPDTGPVHIARALEIPVVGLYGHTNPWRVGPWHRYQDLWIDRYTDEGASPDPSRFDPKHGRMETITAEEVLEKARDALTVTYQPPGQDRNSLSVPSPSPSPGPRC